MKKLYARVSILDITLREYTGNLKHIGGATAVIIGTRCTQIGVLVGDGVLARGMRVGEECTQM